EGGRGRCSITGFDAGEIERHAQHGDGAFQRIAVKGAGEHDVGGALVENDVAGEAEFVGAEVAADDVGGATMAGDRAGNRAVLVHHEVGGGFFRAFRGGVGQLPFSSDVSLRRILG